VLAGARPQLRIDHWHQLIQGLLVAIGPRA
jgi:hypothetical protein